MNEALKTYLDEAYLRYNSSDFIHDDPIQIPHMFTRKEDIEIAGFLAAILAWGQRKTIINKSKELMQRMDFEPYNFIIHASEREFEVFQDFKHRTFNGDDCQTIMVALAHLYKDYGGMEQLFTQGFQKGGAYAALHAVFDFIFSFPHLKRTYKHIARPSQGSAAKRINMFLRWMVRSDNMGVDFGLWKGISSADLICPLDLHVGRAARKLGLLQRKHNDWKAAVELTENLKLFDPHDPVKYDFALFGASMYDDEAIPKI